jgi:hypothetical protein
MKALKEAQVTFINSDSGKNFAYVITPSFTKSNSLNSVYTVLTNSGAIKSANGKVDGNSVVWYKGKEFLSSKNILLLATLESDENSPGNTSSGEQEKSCGLFGIELPLILLTGLVFSGNLKRRRKK